MTDVPGHAAGAVPPPEPPPSTVDEALRTAVRELERHAASLGWDRPASLYALVPTEELLAREPALAEVLGLDADLAPGGLTPVEQEALPAEESLEAVLERVEFGGEVYGVAAVVERLVLPPSVAEVPGDPEAAMEFARSHPDRQEVRIVAGVTRARTTYCALRLRSHDDDFAVVESEDLVPGLLELLLSTLEP